MSGALAVGIDSSSSSLEIAREALGTYPPDIQKRSSFIAMDARKLACADATFDRIFMLDLVEHLYPEALAETLAEAHRVLKPGGLLIVHTEPNRNYARLAVKAFEAPALGRLIRPLTRTFTGSPVPFSPYREAMHVNEQSPDSLATALEQAGFRARVWCSGIYGFEELRDWRSVLKRVVLSGWPITTIGPLAKTFCVNVWAVAEG